MDSLISRQLRADWIEAAGNFQQAYNGLIENPPSAGTQASEVSMMAIFAQTLHGLAADCHNQVKLECRQDLATFR